MTLKAIEKHRDRIESLSAQYPWVGEMADEAEREFAAMERDYAFLRRVYDAEHAEGREAVSAG